MPKVSVIIPLYKVENYMRKCIDSVLNQTLEQIEVILVNDGSPDNSGKIAEEYAKLDSRVKVIHKENGGLSSARNAGIEVALGEFIAFVDSDDWIEIDMLETLYNNANISKADLSIGNYSKIYETFSENNYLKLKDETFDIKNIGLNNYFYNYYFNYVHGDEAWNKIYRKSVIDNNSIRFERNSEIFSEDKLFNLYFIVLTNKVVSTKRSLYNYVQREGSIMQSAKPDLMFQYVSLMEKFINYTRNKERETELSNIYPIIFFNLINSSMFALYKSGATLKEINLIIRKVSLSPIFRKLMLKLFIGNSVKIYCKKTGRNIISQMKMKVFGLCGYIGLNSWVNRMIIRRYSR
jgi:glycosyltransferase EpsH